MFDSHDHNVIHNVYQCDLLISFTGKKTYLTRNPSCTTELWLLPTDASNSTIRVPIYGCLGWQPDPRTFRCPNRGAVGVDMGGGAFTVLSIDEPCAPNAPVLPNLPPPGSCFLLYN